MPLRSRFPVLSAKTGSFWSKGYYNFNIMLCLYVQTVPQFFTNMKIIVWEWILKIPLSYIVKTDEEILPRAAVADDTYKISHKLLEPSWPEGQSSFEVSILIFLKCGNAVRVHQEGCWSHFHLPITFTAAFQLLQPQGTMGWAQDLPCALMPGVAVLCHSNWRVIFS